MPYNFDPVGALNEGRAAYQKKQDAEQARKMNEQVFEERKRTAQAKRYFKKISMAKQLSDDGDWMGLLKVTEDIGKISPEFAEGSQTMANNLANMNFDEVQAGINRSYNQGMEIGAINPRKTVKAAGKAAGIGNISPKDFTVESLGKYQDSGDIKDLQRYSPKQATIGGVVHGLNPVTQKWEPLVDATSKDLTIQAEALSNIKADRKSRLDFATSKTKWQTGMPKFKSKIASERDSQKILESTANQIKSRINGWSTKYGASLSRLPGSDARTLAKLLNTLKAHSAFSTLTDLKNSGGTLGAISEAELVLLESKLGALDQGGDASELMRVVDQISSSNLSSIGRLETEFNNTNKMYSGSFDDFQLSQKPIETNAGQQGGLTPDKQKRLEELRRMKAAGKF